MSILVELKERIQLQFGSGHFHEKDYSFLQPGGNDHLVQFLFKNFSDEYWELDEWNRNHLLLIDIAVALNLQFKLDVDGRFAVLEYPIKGNARPVQAIIDLRDDLLAIVYYFGDIKKCLRLNQQLTQNTFFRPCYIDSAMFFQITEVFERVIGVDYDFEQSSSLFLEPIIMKGQLKGELVHQMFAKFSDRYANYLNICALSGYLIDGAQGSITLFADGAIHTDACRLSSFIEIVSYVLDFLTIKYQALSGNYLIKWQQHPQNRILKLEGNPIEIELPYPVQIVDGLVKYLMNGNKDFLLIGISERVSRKLWSIKSTEIMTAEQIEFEISDNLVRVFLRERRAIPLYDKVEQFLRKHVSAKLENWNH
ncbi:MAG: hypothetical protein HQ517_13185 [SAR324 cluster bacterium]|nr:hypothetical protein [SAR324 cluster bacterium]